MANPTKNKHGVYMYVVRVPTDLVQVVGKRVYSISLKTKDPTEARKRFLTIATDKEREHKALRGSPEAVPLVELVAMAGEVYRGLRDEAAASSGPDDLEAIYEALRARAEDRQWLDSLAKAKILERGLFPDPRTQDILANELAKAFNRLAPEVSKMSRGDFTPDKNLPVYSAAVAAKPARGTTIGKLLEIWELEHQANGRAVKTVADYRNIVKAFKAHLGHDDATKVTRGQIKTFCVHLMHDKGLSAKTVNGRYLTCLKAIFRAGYERELIEQNPAAAVQQKVGKRQQSRSPGFTDAEAALILSVADRAMLPPADGSKDPRTRYLKRVGRWVPWVLCYTGARVAEITQLRKEDVQEVDGIPFIRITPEAGSVKTGQYRDVPVHPHLVEMGFLDFVRTSPDGPLFYDPNAKRKGTGITQAQWAGNELGRWLKTELGEAWPAVQPNHAWRHRFKTLGRVHGIGAEFIDAIQGHSNKTVAAMYGEMPLKAMHREIKKLPRVLISEPAATAETGRPLA
ncbi:integrase [Rhizobium sp. CRIBSB]|nr:integrase [Rhizobium sp. CRIBSB]